MSNSWVSYKNGNYTVSINLEDGTKVRHNDKDCLIPDTIENFDYKITQCCDMMCPFCFESSSPDGKHGDIMNQKFIDSLHPYTEIAVGGGDALSHPDLIPFLEKCKELKLIPSITVNQVHFERKQELIRKLVDEKLIYGLGVSLTYVTDSFIELIKQYPNAVVHVINGVVTEEQINQLMFQDIKLLILGYKELGRGETLYGNAHSIIDERKQALKSNLPQMLSNGSFSVVSFDNRALQQLDVKSIVSKETWDRSFMGDDGIDGDYTSASMFVDGVTGEFALNSCAQERFPLKDDVKKMFRFLKKKYSVGGNKNG